MLFLGERLGDKRGYFNDLSLYFPGRLRLRVYTTTFVLARSFLCFVVC